MQNTRGMINAKVSVHTTTEHVHKEFMKTGVNLPVCFHKSEHVLIERDLKVYLVFCFNHPIFESSF